MFISLFSKAQYSLPADMADSPFDDSKVSFVSVDIPQQVARKPRKRIANPAASCETIDSMLDSLDSSFSALRQADDKASWTDESLRKGLRRMGPYVPGSDSYTTANTGVLIDRLKAFPSLLFCSLDTKSTADKEGKLPLHFMYAKKVARFTHAFKSKNGAHYEVGAAYFDDLLQKLFWIRTDVTICTATGDVTIEAMRQHSHVKVGKNKWYSRESWVRQNIGDTSDKTRFIVGAMFNFWADRSSQWSVSVKKDGLRMTFCIPDRATSSFFRSRDRNVLTPEGRMRPIVHYVSEHSRLMPDGSKKTIEAHMRGQRRFDWKGYECTVIAPEFQRCSTVSIDVSAHDDVMPDVRTVDDESFGQLLAEMEDSHAMVKA